MDSGHGRSVYCIAARSGGVSSSEGLRGSLLSPVYRSRTCEYRYTGPGLALVLHLRALRLPISESRKGALARPYSRTSARSDQHEFIELLLYELS